MVAIAPVEQDSRDRARPRLAGRLVASGGVLVAACLAYLLAPGHPLGFLGGLPLGWESLALVGVLLCSWFGLGVPRSTRRVGILAWLVIAATVLKGLLTWQAPAYGLAASYFSDDRLAGTPERSTELGGTAAASFTRVEPGAGPDVNLHFFNDVERFNYYDGDGPDRNALPFAVRWEGWLHVPADGDYPLALTASGDAAVFLDERALLTVTGRGGQRLDRVTLPLAAGAHPIRVTLVHPGGAEPVMRLDADFGAGLAPLRPPYVTTSAAATAWLGRDAVATLAARALDAAFALFVLGLIVGLAVGRVRQIKALPGRRLALAERPLLGLMLVAILAHALVTTAGLYRQTVILEGGQDWLTYESYARDILLNGPLMTLGESLGDGKPFFFQPFYPYYLALMHALTGEGLWGPIVLQLVGLGVAGVILYYLAKRLFGAPAAVAALGLYLVLRSTQLDWVARKLLSENLYFVVLLASILLLLRYVDERRLRDLVGAGLLFGVASITRGPTLLYVPMAAGLMVLLLRRSGVAWRNALTAFMLLGAVTAAVAALVPLRNYVVSGRPALVATNGGATLLLAHTPTEKVSLRGIDRHPLYNRLKLDRPTREVVEFIRQDPAGYAATLVPLGLYSLGIPNGIEGAGVIAPDILALTVLYLGALVWLPAARTLRAAPLHAFVLLHLAIMMTFLPYVYGYRQVLPMQLLMLLFGGALLAHLVGRIAARRNGRLGQLPTQVPRAGADPISTTT